MRTRPRRRSAGPDGNGVLDRRGCRRCFAGLWSLQPTAQHRRGREQQDARNSHGDGPAGVVGRRLRRRRAQGDQPAGRWEIDQTGPGTVGRSGREDDRHRLSAGFQGDGRARAGFDGMVGRQSDRGRRREQDYSETGEYEHTSASTHTGWMVDLGTGFPASAANRAASNIGHQASDARRGNAANASGAQPPATERRCTSLRGPSRPLTAPNCALIAPTLRPDCSLTAPAPRARPAPGRRRRRARRGPGPGSLGPAASPAPSSPRRPPRPAPSRTPARARRRPP